MIEYRSLFHIEENHPKSRDTKEKKQPKLDSGRCLESALRSLKLEVCSMH